MNEETPHYLAVYGAMVAQLYASKLGSPNANLPREGPAHHGEYGASIIEKAEEVARWSERVREKGV